jgi:hypothetical protein
MSPWTDPFPSSTEILQKLRQWKQKTKVSEENRPVHDERQLYHRPLAESHGVSKSKFIVPKLIQLMFAQRFVRFISSETTNTVPFHRENKLFTIRRMVNTDARKTLNARKICQRSVFPPWSPKSCRPVPRVLVYDIVHNTRLTGLS